ncbi:MAG: aspartyl-tRNA(Asn)/glutamyl-tRNA(Gln) amidotransferase subunit [Solirubrobacterales bacterium]|jgi:Asp-tRNA(Asn)/Glu-tRNA(Gln) amidotransferase A subunit family amidase|nr:aspartyl-tRNA(Asn)/glutamyl-tRNA(Gln) amidotransferase subunit [Solirubrobacterales bacterium]
MNTGLDLSLREQAAAIAGGELDPAELLEATLSRIEERNPALNAVVATFPDRSREMLAAAPRGPLYGVPIVIKDEWPLPWRAQRFGAAEMLAEAEAGESAPYRALRDAGAVIVGVGNMHELGASSTGNISVYGPARNPWSPDRCPGGSSSGPAASVAARLVAGAVGADGVGSIRYPAAYCGLTGLKPTFGRSAMAGHHMAEVSTTIVSGALCADAGDCRTLDSVLFEEELAAGNPQGLRIGVIRGEVSEDVAPEVREACENAVEELRRETGGEVREIELPELAAATLATVLIANSESLGGITPERLNRLDPELSPLGRGLLKYRLLVPAIATIKAGRVRTLARQTLARVFEEVDVLACPTVPAVAPPLDAPVVELPSGHLTADEANVRGGALANLTGIPAISVPVGSSEGLPVALQLQGAWGRDELLLDAAEALERANGRRWVEATPPALGAEPLEA